MLQLSKMPANAPTPKLGQSQNSWSIPRNATANAPVGAFIPNFFWESQQNLTIGQWQIGGNFRDNSTHSYIARLILLNEQRAKIFHDRLLVSLPPSCLQGRENYTINPFSPLPSVHTGMRMDLQYSFLGPVGKRERGTLGAPVYLPPSCLQGRENYTVKPFSTLPSC